MYIRKRETSTNSYEAPMYDYRFRLLCCYTQLDDRYFGGSYIEPYWTRDYKSTSGRVYSGMVFSTGLCQLPILLLTGYTREIMIVVLYTKRL